MNQEVKHPSGEAAFDINKFQSLVDEGYQKIKSDIKKSILVIGDTGTGKSTLINGLIGKKMEAIQERRKLIIQLQSE